MNLETL